MSDTEAPANAIYRSLIGYQFADILTAGSENAYRYLDVFQLGLIYRHFILN
ncbi:hypothetical protein [Polynucleobacter sp. MWH-UH25E]|uniref:hypothetical protein n=1 Tax=Polynucleobacter sp. MWH-UH25E TaxID=1855616 RepID=UPI001BFDFA3F|nr:hypothetical protein [Polynucleobacter sp. MWH-UH25E]QWD62376.1 hypothetical protein ICV39_01800 [Polynucleobacter sp. MWH-UH25E]